MFLNAEPVALDVVIKVPSDEFVFPCVRRTLCRSAAGAAGDRPLQRLVGRLSNQESKPRQTEISAREFRAPVVTAHSFFLPDQKVTPGSATPDSPSPNSPRLSTFQLHPKCQVRPTICRSAASPPHKRFVDVTPMSLRRDRPLQRLVRRQWHGPLRLVRESHSPIAQPRCRSRDHKLADLWTSHAVSPHRRKWCARRRQLAGRRCKQTLCQRTSEEPSRNPRLSVERFAVKRWAAVRGRPSVS